MNAIINWIRGNRPRAYGIAVVLVGWLALVPVPDLIATGVLTILGILLGTDVHSAVTPVEKAAAATRSAAAHAASDVASQLDKTSAGASGVLTEQAVVIATDAAISAADNALGDIGIDDKGHRK